MLQVDGSVLTLEISESPLPGKLHLALRMGNAAIDQEFDKVLYFAPKIRR
jgi:hypothetical protein